MAKTGKQIADEIMNSVEDDSGLPDKSLFRVDEVATHFDVSCRTIYLWIDHGLLEAEKYKGIIRVPRQSIITFRLNSRMKPLEWEAH